MQLSVRVTAASRRVSRRRAAAADAPPTAAASPSHTQRTIMARGDLELSFVTKITSPKNLLKALAGAIFGVATRCSA